MRALKPAGITASGGQLPSIFLTDASLSSMGPHSFVLGKAAAEAAERYTASPE